MTDHSLRARALCLLASLIFFSALLVPTAQAQEEQVLNYRNAEIRAFIDDMSLLTGRMFIVDPRVSGNVTVISHEPLAADELFDVFFATLQVNGYSAVPTSSGAYKIVLNKIAAEQADRKNGGRTPDERFVTEVFQLQSANALTALNLVEPIVHSDGRAVANRDSDYLIVVDYAANMERIRKVIGEIDRDNSVVETIKLKNISAREMARLVSRLVESENEGRGGARFTIVPVEASNAIMIRGEPAAVARMLPVIRRLDESNEARSDIRVVYLNHANAVELVPLLDQISTSLIEATSGPDAAGAARRAAIAAHKGTNSLIINADPDMQNALAGVISRLDVRRAQVLVEAIIVEVTDTAARQLGLQYLIAGSEGSNVPFTATNFTNTGPNLLAATGAVLLRNEEGFDEDVIDNLQQAAVDSLIGLNGFSGGFAGETSDGSVFGVIVNALKNDIDSNILSTPSLMTMDNEEASIIVGQEVPITRGEVLSSDNTNPFRTFERQDVGVQLDILPQINEGDTIKLNIRQEVSAIVGPVTAQSQELVLSKREIETTVMVDNGDIIVLGGLIEQDEQVSVERVPLLGDIPILGELFKSRSKSRVKTNLMVFLRPTIVRNAKDLEDVTGRKFNYMRSQQLLREGGDVPSLDVLMQDVIGADVPGASAPAETGE